MSTELPESERPWRLYAAVVIGVALIATGLFFAGGQSEVVEIPDGDDQDSEGQRQRECEEQLAGIMAAVDPKQLGLSSRQSDRAYDLNLWREDCGSLFAGEQIALDEPLVRQLLPADVVERVLGAEYTVRDIAHLRTTLLLRQAAEHVTAGEQDPVRQAVRLFDFVQRNVLDGGAESPTMTPYEILLIGRGNARQRAWLLAELLRQVELLAVIVRPATASEESSDQWLLGVLIDRGGMPQVYLFDPLIGVPIPAADERTAREPLVTLPATLAEVRSDDSLLRELDIPESPYRFKAEQLADVEIGLIGHSSQWSNRIAAIDYAIDLRGAIFYDGLGENRLKPVSQHGRVVAAGKDSGWTADNVFVWLYPEQESTAFGTTSATGAELLANYLAVLNGPIIQDITDPETGLKLQWDHPLIDARNLHITGACLAAIKEYNQIRGGVNVFTIDPINDRARESAVYWTTSCQYELGELESVMNTGVGGHYPPAFRTNVQPIWPDGMGRLVGLSLAQLGAFPQGAQVLQQFAPEVPHGLGYLIRRWERLAQPPADSSPSDQTPADPPIKPTVEPDAPTEPAGDAAAPSSEAALPSDAATESTPPTTRAADPEGAAGADSAAPELN